MSSTPPPIVGFSRALYSNWLLHIQLRLLVDAGEGLQIGLDDRLYVPTHLAITHGHADHLLGLPGLVAARRFSMGDREKPLTIVYPDGLQQAGLARRFIESLWPGVPFPTTWVAAAPGARIPLGKARELEAFATRHTSRDVTLGYLAIETRRRLRPEYLGFPQAELERRARAGEREAMTETFRHILFAHTGDAMPVDPAVVAGADLLIHDATFLNADDRKWDIHATTEEAMVVAREARVKCLVLHHLSVRYERDPLLTTLRQQVRNTRLLADCWLLDDGRLVQVADGALGSSARSGGPSAGATP